MKSGEISDSLQCLALASYVPISIILATTEVLVEFSIFSSQLDDKQCL